MSSWLDIRYRSIDPLSARLSDLIQKQIDAETKDMEVTDEDTIEPIIPLESRMIMRDNLFRGKLRDVVTGQITFLPQDPDGKDMRLWLWNEHGGRYLTDHSFMNNICELVGTEQSKLINNTDDDGISGTRNVNRMINDQHIKVYDNENIRIKEIAATATGFTVFLRIYVTFLGNESLTGRRAVLFSKIDSEQVDFAYACHLSESGTLTWFVKDANKERSISLANAIPGIRTINAADFAFTDFAPEDYYTAVGQAAPPCTYTFTDWAFEYTFSTKRLSIIKNGELVADSDNAAGPTNTAVGRWVLNEGSGSTALNKVSGSPNGTITGLTWITMNGRPYLEFPNTTNNYVSVPNHAAIQSVTSFTVSLWYYPLGTPTTGLFDNLIYKNWANNGAWAAYLDFSGSPRFVFAIKNDAGVTASAVKSNVFAAGLSRWYHLVIRWTDGGTIKITVDNVNTVGSVQSGPVNTAPASLLYFGAPGSSVPQGYMRDVCYWNKELTDAEVTTIFNAGETYPSTEGLVGWWKLQEGGDIGNQTEEPIVYTRKVFNNIAGGNDGIITNATWGAVGLRTDEPYLRFDGNNDLVNITNYTAIQNMSSFTVSFWYYPQAVPITDGFLIAKGTVGGANSWLIYYQVSGYCRFSIWNNSTTRFDITFNSAFPTLNKWYHIVAKVTLGTTGKIFLNNVKSTGGGNVTGTLDTGAAPVRLGGTSTSNTPTGYIHDLKIWSRELSDTEVSYLYNQGHSHSAFPPWAGQPPPLPEVPEPVFVPFTQIYDVLQPGTKEYVRLHKIVASGFTARYTGADGSVIAPVTAAFAPIYDQNTIPGGTGTPETICDIAQNSSSHVELSSDENFRAGNKLASGSTHIGKTLTIIVPRARKQGSPTGTVYGRVWDSGGTLKATIGSASVASWTSTDGNQPALTGSATSILAAGDVVGIEFAGGDNSNNIDVDQDDDSPDSNWTGVTGTTGGWGTTDIGSGSIGMQLTATVGSNAEVKLFAGDDGRTMWGAYVPSSSSPLYSKKPTRVTLKMQAVGLPTGNLKCWFVKAGTDIQLGTTVAINTIPTASPGDIIFTDVNNGLAAGYALTTGDIVAVEISGGTTNATNYIKVFTNTTSVVANVNERRFQDQTLPPFLGQSYGWVDYANNDPVMKIEEGGYNIPQQDPWVDMNGTTVRAGNKINSASSPCIGKKITKVRFRCKRIGAASGTATCVIRDSTNAIVATMGTKNVNDIGTSAFEDVDFEWLGNTRSAANGDRFLFEYVGTATDYIQLNFKKDATITGAGLYEIGTTYTTTYTDTNAWDVAGSFYEGGTPSDPLARTRVGIKIANTNSTIKASKISKVKVVVRVVGTLPSNVFCRIRRATTDVIAAEIGQIVASTIPLAGAISEQTFTKEPVATYTAQVGDYVTIEYNDGNDTNYLEVMNTPTDAFNSTNTHLSDYNDIVYANFTTKDLVGTLWKDGYTIIPTIEEQEPPRDEYYSHDLHLFSGGYTWLLDDTALNPCNGIFTDVRFYRKPVTTAELLNIYINRYDRKPIYKGEVAYLGFFWLPPFT